MLSARLAFWITERADHRRLKARWLLQGLGDLAGVHTPFRLGQRFGGSAGERGAAAKRACDHDAATEQGAPVQQSIAGGGFERRYAASAFPHSVTPYGSASFDAIR